MLINNWDIADAGAQQWNVVPGYHAISNESDWSQGTMTPVFLKGETGAKRMKITLLIRQDGGRQAILDRCSEILSRLLVPVELVLDDFEHRFYGVLATYSFEENPMKISSVKFNRAAKLTLEFDCYEFALQADGSWFSASLYEGQVVLAENTGNLLTPAIIEITPQIGAASVTLSGICRNPDTLQPLPITIRNLQSGKTVILDGETGLFTQEGKLKTEIDIWARPTLLPGENRISVDSDRMEITVRFRPRFM